jgi:hypothetical protein
MKALILWWSPIPNLKGFAHPWFLLKIRSRMKINHLIAVAALVGCAVLGFLLQQSYSRISELEQKVSQVAKAPSLVAKPEAAAEALAAMPPSQTPKPTESESSPQSVKRANFLNQLSEQMNTPEGREMMAAQMEIEIGKLYADYFEMHNLTPEQQAKLKKLLAGKFGAGQSLGFRIMSGSLPKEERQSAMEELKQKMKDSDSAIALLFGDDAVGLEKLKKYEDSQPERMALSQLKTSLDAEKASLSEDQEQALMNAMYEERKNFKFDRDFSNQNDITNLDFLTTEHVDRFLVQQAAMAAKARSRATGILNDQQMRTFEQNQQSQLNQSKMGLKMAAQIFGEK